jgi:hypothetical protein
MKDPLFDDSLLKDIGMEIGNIIVTASNVHMEDLTLSHNEYPKSEGQILHSSDCQILLWIKHLPDPRSNEEWVIIETIIQIGKKRQLIKRFTDIRIPDAESNYEGPDRRRTKPIRIL